MTSPCAGWLPVYAAPAEGDALASTCGAVQLGVGKVAAAVAMCEVLARRRPRGVLLFGVGGAYPSRHRQGAALQVGDVVFVDPDAFGDEGVATPQGFLDLPALRLPGVPQLAGLGGAAAAAAQQRLGVGVVSGTTVSTASGTDELSAALAARTGAAVESMEGAAVAFACARAAVPFLQLRAVSNWTGDRDRGGWDLPRAVAAVQAAVRRLLAD